MNCRFKFKNTHPKSSTTKHAFQFAFFVAFGLWVLYQMRRSYTKKIIDGGSFTIHLNNERMGRKGSVKSFKPNHRVDSGVILDDVTNPAEVDEREFQLVEDERGKDEKEPAPDGVRGQESVSKSTDPGMNESGKGMHSFADENGIPQHVRDKLVGNESTRSATETHVEAESIITIDTGNGSRGTREDS